MFLFLYLRGSVRQENSKLFHLIIESKNNHESVINLLSALGIQGRLEIENREKEQKKSNPDKSRIFSEI